MIPQPDARRFYPNARVFCFAYNTWLASLANASARRLVFTLSPHLERIDILISV